MEVNIIIIIVIIIVNLSFLLLKLCWLQLCNSLFKCLP